MRLAPRGWVTVVVNWGLARYERARARVTHQRERPSHGSTAPVSNGGPGFASLVILNWQRPDNVRRILDRYVAFDRIDDIIVWNNNGAAPFTYVHRKVRCINSDEFGLNTRWVGCLLARHLCVIVHDDDLVCDETTLDGLIAYHLADPDRTYTLHGRNPTRANQYADKVDHVAEPTECDVHLTRVTCVNRRWVSRYFDALAAMGIEINPQRGGGEDIVISYAIRAATGRRPLVVPGAYEDLVAPQALANRYGSQAEERTAIMHACQQWFERERIDHAC